MNLFTLLAQSRALINVEPEESCAFMFYRRINDLPLLNNKSNSIGLYKRVGVFIYNILIRASLFNSVKNKAKYFFYSGTKNQYDSLRSTFTALSAESSVVSVLDGRWLHRTKKYEANIKFTPKIIIVASCLFLLRSVGLYKRLKHTGLSDSINLYFDRF